MGFDSRVLGVSRAASCLAGEAIRNEALKTEAWLKFD